MYAWNVLLDIKTDFSLEDLHEEKLNEIKDLPFAEQVKKIDEDIAVENMRLVELKEEREKEKHGDPMYFEHEAEVEIDINLDTKKDKTKKNKDKSPREDKGKDKSPREDKGGKKS